MKQLILLVLVLTGIVGQGQILDDQCDYSHRSVFMDIDHFEKGEYASTIASKGEAVYISNDAKRIKLEDVTYNVYNAELFEMPKMEGVEQIIVEADQNANFIGITKNGSLLTITVLRPLNEGYLEQESYTFSNRGNLFNSIKRNLILYH